ncbi:hypothetical protein VP01_71g2 [Puccinia sorghi]|uniref:Uncharacterized protein n=1 Tax=Puccinia sorghi TaxID=27349 RepID=A0A0L6UD69_9BASI|nr:hypothetical protein VP01_71g2 [Puccinia sorghi]
MIPRGFDTIGQEYRGPPPGKLANVPRRSGKYEVPPKKDDSTTNRLIMMMHRASKQTAAFMRESSAKRLGLTKNGRHRLTKNKLACNINLIATQTRHTKKNLVAKLNSIVRHWNIELKKPKRKQPKKMKIKSRSTKKPRNCDLMRPDATRLSKQCGVFIGKAVAAGLSSSCC